MKNEILNKIDELQNEIIDYAKKLVEFPTTSGNELEAQEYLKTVLKDLNFDTIDMWEPDFNKLKEHESFISQRDNFNNSPNLVGVLKGSGNGKSLIFNSHIDIIPEGNINEWKYPPFNSIVEDGKIYGRGISDMKGTDAALLGVIKVFNELDIKLKGDIIFESVIEEETGSAGSLACALKGYQADAAIVPEPTNFSICPAQQGAAWFKIHVKGKSAHAGQRYKGVSAIDKAYIIIEAIKNLETQRNKEYENTLYKDNPIPFTINVGTIKAGDWPSSVPESAVIEVRMSIPPGEEVKEAKNKVEEWIVKISENDEWLKNNIPKIEWFGAFWGSAEISSSHSIVETLKDSFNDIRKTEPKIEGTPWGTDAHIMTKYANTPSVVFGPGETAHCPDEYIEIEDLIDYTKMLALIILEWSG